MPASRLPLFATLAGCVLLTVVTLRAGDGGFGATLSVEQKNSCGLPTLTPAEAALLDRLVAGEVALARQQGVREFSENFIARCSTEERQQAGLDRLTPEQQARLNEQVAAAIAAQPKPKERPRLKDSEVLAARPAEIHGSVTLSYGWGGGRSIRGGELWLDYYDPENRFGLSLGLANYSGDGFPDRYDGYGYDNGALRSYGRAPFYYDGSYRGIGRDDFAYGQGQSFRRGGGDYSFGPGGGHRH